MRSWTLDPQVLPRRVPVPDILLATLNARYAHAAFGLRCLMANMGELAPRTALLEREVSVRTVDLVEEILAARPRILGLGVYIWNAAAMLALVADLTALRPDLVIVLGGPEISHETEGQALFALADHVITGEGDLAFAALCRSLLAGDTPPKLIHAPLPDLGVLASPYSLYTDTDIRQRVIYAEASRGCPFKCEFCLSSLDTAVRSFPLDRFLADLDDLFRRGARQIKLVDRTFNLNIETSRSILAFLLERAHQGLFSHLEMVPDRLPDALRALLRQFPPGTLQVEVGIQTLDKAVSKRISRRLDIARMAENLRFLREETQVHVHADLIVGLPGEGLDGFGQGFDALVAMRPQEIQVGLLKRLKGTPIIRHEVEHGLVYSRQPPFEVLSTAALPFDALARLRRLSRYWDLVANSGNFVSTLPILLGATPFASFLAFCDWLWAQTGATHNIALPRLAELVYTYLVARDPALDRPAAESLWDDLLGPGRNTAPGWLMAALPDRKPPRRVDALAAGPKRQARHREGPPRS